MKKRKSKKIEAHLGNLIGGFVTLLVGLEILGNLFRLTFDFKDYYIVDLRIHWKEMLEASICEELENKLCKKAKVI